MVEAEGRASWAASARATARLSSPTRTRSRISRALMRMDLGGGGVCIIMGCLGVLLWPNRGQSDIHFPLTAQAAPKSVLGGRHGL